MSNGRNWNRLLSIHACISALSFGVAVPCRVAVSPICFFDLMLNNAPALRAGNKQHAFERELAFCVQRREVKFKHTQPKWCSNKDRRAEIHRVERPDPPEDLGFNMQSVATYGKKSLTRVNEKNNEKMKKGKTVFASNENKAWKIHENSIYVSQREASIKFKSLSKDPKTPTIR